VAQRIEPAARVYAEALYGAARDAGRTREVDRDFRSLLEELSSNRLLLQALANPAIPRDAKKRVVTQLLEESEPLLRHGALVLTNHGRVSLLADLATAYAELVAAEDRILTVEVTTAVELDDAQVNDLPEIIGGLVLKARGVLLDASIRRRLEDIRRALIRTPLPVGSEA
jgi:F-type H+-transporting ATPase subunit delta